MGVFLDSGFFLGLLNRTDHHHEEINKKFQKISTGESGLIYTSSLIISEATSLILIRTHNNSIILNAFWEFLYGEDKFIRIIYPSSNLITQSKHIFTAHNKNVKEKRNYLSFVDASNIAICREFQILSIIATDGDFKPYLNIL